MNNQPPPPQNDTDECETPHLHPNTPMALYSMEAIGKHVSESLTAKDMVEVLHRAFDQDPEGEAMLLTQAQILDQLFHRLTINAMTAAENDETPVKHYVHDKRVHLLLRLQKQCRATLDSLRQIRDNYDDRYEERIRKKHERTIQNDIEREYDRAPLDRRR